MIDVGKVVVREAWTGRYEGSTPEESVTVRIGTGGIGLEFSESLVDLSPDQAVELGQLLLKAAECQPEYAAAAKALDEERTRLAARYKDMISGLGLLGLDSVIDVVDAHGTFSILEP